MTSQVTAEQFMQVLREGMPTATATPFDVVELARGAAALRLTTTAQHLRPGETVAGPVLFWLADLAMYAAVMSVIGPVPLAVTTDATVHFLRRPRAGVLVARARVLKEGRRLVVGEITVAHDGEEGDQDAPVAHFVMSYSVPPT